MLNPMSKLDEYLARLYASVVTPDETTDGSSTYVAYHPDLDGCMSDGETPDEALANLEEAKKLYIETLVEKGLEVPPPKGLSFTETFASTATTVQGRIVTTTLPRQIGQDDSTNLPVSVQVSVVRK